MNKKPALLMATFVFAFSTISSANEELYKLLSKGRFNEAYWFLMLKQPVDLSFVPQKDALTITSLAAQAEKELPELVRAIQSITQMEELLEKGNEAEAKKRFITGLEQDEVGVPFVHRAALAGRRDLVEYFIKKLFKVVAVDLIVDNSGDTLLHYAVRYNSTKHTAMVRFLLGQGADANKPNSFGETPLGSAAKAGCGPIVDTLLKHEGTNLDETALEIISYLFNYRIFVYNVDLDTRDGFVPREFDWIIYEGGRPTTARDFRIAHVAVEPNAPETHFERLMEQETAPVAVAQAFVPTAAQQPLPPSLTQEEISIQIAQLLGPVGLNAFLMGFQAGK